MIESSKSLIPKEASLARIYRRSARNLVLLSFVMYADRSIIDLKRYADNIIKPKLERLNGGLDMFRLVEVRLNTFYLRFLKIGYRHMD
ncbi:hypothetical protein [Borrelia miyamotoi]|uniref:hypothetical protein n=1 Tax=Borrelia miyamotoi TaxID=47466 RepID=UPI001F07ED39|nr:hypothetical protein [Borrelia miyamotoi]